MRRPLALLAVGALTLTAAAALPSSAVATTVGSTTWQITSGMPSGGPLTLDLTPVSLRGPDFDVKVQNADGSFTDVTASLPAEHDYLGTVPGHPDMAVAATQLSDGTMQGEIVLDRGVTWWFSGNAVTGTRGESNPAYKWPNRNGITSDIIGPGQVRTEIGWDIDSSLFTQAAPSGFGSDPVRAIDIAQLSMNEMRLPYIQDVGITPVLGTVILRGSSAHDPYASLTASTGAYLGAVNHEWNSVDEWAATPGLAPNNQAQVISNRIGGGNAYIGGNSSAVGGSASGWAVVARHEAAHNWGVYDENGGDPEGGTIQSGNRYARWDSTEVNAIGATRQGLVNSSRALGTYTTTDLPPYAATDYIQAVAQGPVINFNPLANDHSANGSALTLLSVQPTSALGNPVRLNGNTISYVPNIAATTSIDTFTYVVADANGMTSTGLVMVKNLAPFKKYEAESGTLSSGATIYPGNWDHSGASAVKLPAGGQSVSWTVTQPVERDVTLSFWTKNWSAGTANVTVDGGTPTALSVPAASAGLEGEGQLWGSTSVTVHLTAGTHTISYASTNVDQYVDYMTTSWPDAAPVWNTQPSFTLSAGQAFSVSVAADATDADLPNDTLKFFLDTPPTWLHLSGSTLSGTAPTTPGTYTATIVANDASGVRARTTAQFVVQ